jgi:hypothetical protein
MGTAVRKRFFGKGVGGKLIGYFKICEVGLTASKAVPIHADPSFLIWESIKITIGGDVPYG